MEDEYKKGQCNRKRRGIFTLFYSRIAMKKLFYLFACLCGFSVEASAAKSFVAAQSLGKRKIVMIENAKEEDYFHSNFFSLESESYDSPVKQNCGACPVSPISPVRTKEMRCITPEFDRHPTPELGS